MKVLNLFAGIGGNRKLWKDVDVLAIENNRLIAKCYRDNFPQDEIFVTDALTYVTTYDLSEFKFIWASPPCVTHTMFQMQWGFNIPDLNAIYGLYLFLEKKYPNIPFVIENVRPWYKAIIPPTFKLGRHYFWSNRSVPGKLFQKRKFENLSFHQLAKEYGLFVERIEHLEKLERRKILRNCVHPLIGKYIFDIMTGKFDLLDYILDAKEGL